MTTTIEADSRYTHLISNGDISRRTNPEGRPVPKAGDPSRKVITYENRLPMAPLSLLVCAGTWDDLIDEVAYPSDRKVRLEYLVPPGMKDFVRIPMEILKESIQWIGKTQDYEYTGETYRTICMNKSNFRRYGKRWQHYNSYRRSSHHRTYSRFGSLVCSRGHRS